MLQNIESAENFVSQHNLTPDKVRIIKQALQSRAGIFSIDEVQEKTNLPDELCSVTMLFYMSGRTFYDIEQASINRERKRIEGLGENVLSIFS